VTEDEAFIRRIVDSPGDHLPRLVYADWLDERGDPRGAYLRAEHEWAQSVRLPHTSREPIDIPPQLLRLAEELDPVWVARVSTPPIGVCCEHFILMDRGVPITNDNIDLYEQRCGAPLPADFRAFLLNYNGGWFADSVPLARLRSLTTVWVTPDGEELCTTDGQYDGYEGCYRFYPLAGTSGPDPGGSLEAWLDMSAFRDGPNHNVDSIEPRMKEWYDQFIDIGRNPELIYGIRLGITGPVRGRVHYFDYSVGICPGYPDYDTSYADSFADYLSTIPGFRPYPNRP
jgi:uncharacterized protein (TIGR02996 family)